VFVGLSLSAVERTEGVGSTLWHQFAVYWASFT